MTFPDATSNATSNATSDATLAGTGFGQSIGNQLSHLRVAIGNDHAAFDLKQKIMSELPEIEWLDCGSFDRERVDYPDFADQVVTRVLKDNIPGVLLCGSGQGMALRANRYPHIRAAVVWNRESTQLSRQHNNCNIVCMGQRLLDPELCVELVRVFLTTPFEGGRHQARIDKIDQPLSGIVSP